MSQTNETIIDLGSGNHWSSYKNLYEVIYNATVNKSPEGLYDLENLLRQHKTDFFSLLKQTPKNPIYRDVVLKSAKDGIEIVQQTNRSKIVIPQSMIDDALLISELFDISELISLEFVITGANQEPRFPGLARGPIAVLLYYDSRKCLLSALKLLFQAKSGRSWSIKLNKELQKLIDDYTNELKRDGIVMKCIKHLSQSDLSSEFDKLQRNQALGQGKYRRRLIEIVKEVRQLYADIVFYCSAQSDLNAEQVKAIFEYLANKSEINPDKSLDNVSLTLLISIAYVLDLSLLQSCDECDPLVKELPLVIHPDMLSLIHKEVQQKEFNVKGLDVIIDFIFAISAKTLTLFPINSISNNEYEEEMIIDECIEKKVFEYLDTLCISNNLMKSEEFYLRRFHILVSDFVGLMPLKVKEMRDKGDEMGRIIAAYMSEGLQAPETLCCHFEKLLILIARLYALDTFGLSDDIWKCALGGQDEKQSLLKFVNFQKFIGSSVDSYLPQILHQPLLNVLTSFAKVSPLNIYNILKSSINQNSQFSLDHIFNTFHSYFSAFRGHDPFNQSTNQSSIIQDSGLLLHRQNTQVNLKAIEIDILCASLELLEAIVQGDRTCCLSIAENQRYSCISTFAGLLLFPIPKKLKARILCLLSGLAQNVPSIAFNIWLKMESLLPKPQLSVTNFSQTFQQRTWQTGISVEIEDIEPKYEEYSVTIAYLKALNSLMKHVNCSTNPQSSIEASLDFIINSIFLKCNCRVYKNEQEKWIIKASCLQIINQVLKLIELQTDGKMFKSVFSLMSQILQENQLFRTIMEVIEDTVDFFTAEANPSDAHKDLKAECLLKSLTILNIVADKESEFIDQVHNVPGFPTAMISNLANLFFQVNHRTQRIERLAIMIKILSIPISNIQIECLRLFRNLILSNADVSENILLQIKPFNLYHDDYFVHCFVECIESDDKILRLEALRFLVTCLRRDTSTSGQLYGFSFRLFGFDRNKNALRVPGADGQTFNCMHSIISLVESRSSLLNDERCMCMEILYQLCKVPEICEIVLRFLRTSYDLLANYLQYLQKRILVNKDEWLADDLINEIGWFFRILAIEIKTTAFSNLKTHCNSYVRMLIGDNAEKKLTDLVPDKVFTHVQPDMPKWEFFDQNELWKIITDHSINESNSIDVKALKARLINEVKMVSIQIGVVQSNLIYNEIEKIIKFATGLNSFNLMYQLKLTYFEGWRELCEIMFTVDCLDVDSNLKVRLLLDVAQKLLANVSMSDSIPALITPVASVLLLACSSLRNSQPELQLKTRLISTGKYIMDLLESSSSSVVWNKYKRARIDLYSALIHIYRVLPPSSIGGIRLSYRLLEKISKDILSGQELDKVVSMSVLIESDPSWIKDMAKDGTLRLIMDSLIEDDRQIKASKFNIACKAFYSFESKMALLFKISLDTTGNRILNHLGVIDTLSNLECFDLYSFLIGQSDICYKMVVSILRLLLSMICSEEDQDILQVAQFVSNHSSVINDILRINEPLRGSEEGITVLVLITSLLSRLTNNLSKQLLTSFHGMIYHYSGKILPSENKILSNILSSYVDTSLNNSKIPLFSPTWESKQAFANVDLPSLGIIISIVENNIDKCRQSNDDHKTIEFCIYLLWHHLNLCINVPEVHEAQREQIQRLLYESNRVISDMFFSKIQSTIVNNTFVDAFVRRIKGLVLLNK